MIDSHVANLLQLMSLPLELLGFSLAFIEIRYRPVADYLREAVLGTGHTLARNSTPAPGHVVGVCALSLAVFVTAWLLVEFSTLELLIWASYLAVLGVIGLLLLVMGNPVLRLTLKLISRFAAGREIGTLGLILAAGGLLAESYQFMDVLYVFRGVERSGLPLSRFWETVAVSIYAVVAVTVVFSYAALIAGLAGYYRRHRSGAADKPSQ